MISVHKICWAHSTVSNYGCVSVFTHKLWVSVFSGPLFVCLIFSQLCIAVSIPHTPLITSCDTSNTTKLRALSVCWQERTSNRGGGAEQTSLAAHWLVQPVLCQGMKKEQSTFFVSVASLPSETLLEANATQSLETIIPEPLHVPHAGMPSNAWVN